MKILLIGKYPPMQGGIASKTYWLYKNLEKKGFEFKIVTWRDDIYSVQDLGDDADVIVVGEKSPPWHLPHTGLLPDRLTNAAAKIINSFAPDIVETNYLWPFSNTALLIAKMINKPLLIRHAGSDIQKFKSDPEFREILNFYFEKASVVVTNVTSRQVIEVKSRASEKIFCLPRYVPDPEIFKWNDTSKAYDISFAGKVNYHWDSKGLLLLLEVIKKRKLRALFNIGGKYINEILDLISSKGFDEYISVKSFVLPEKMPGFYAASRYVWCWDEGMIDDFSNIVWEATFCGVPCIINDAVLGRPETANLIKNFPHLIHHFSPSNICDFEFGEERNQFIDNDKIKSILFNEYIEMNVDIYQKTFKINS